MQLVSVIPAMLRILYFGSVVFTAFWLLRLLYRRFFSPCVTECDCGNTRAYGDDQSTERAWSVDERGRFEA